MKAARTAANETDRCVLRRLAEQTAEIAALPVQRHNMAEWQRLNGLGKGAPLVYVCPDQVPWHEFTSEEELQPECSDPWARNLETQLRRTLYQWRHFSGHMVVEGLVRSPVVYHDTGLGIAEDVEVVRTDEANPIISRDFHPQIDREEDIQKIKFPEISLDPETTQREYEQRMEVFEGILPVVPRGTGSISFAPWDELVRWWDVERVLLDLVLRPELVHMAMDRLVAAYMHRLDQLEQLGLLALNNNDDQTGSGGLGYCYELPQPDFNPSHVRPVDQWGSAMAQIFSAISPEMHEEFALRYERRWLARFGLTYYGCCEPLHHKINQLRSTANLRKVSMSPWADLERGAQELGDHYVLSYKPHPAIVAEHVWRPDVARTWFRAALAKTRGGIVEVILKDISTVRYEPGRLWEWTRIAVEEAERTC